MTDVQVWRVAVESQGWIGPVAPKLNGVDITYPWQTQLVLQGEYPDASAWVDPVNDPINQTAGKGFLVSPINPEDAGTYVLCILINADTNEKPVLKEVGAVIRY